VFAVCFTMAVLIWLIPHATQVVNQKNSQVGGFGAGYPNYVLVLKWVFDELYAD
jgi:hypothetical protein